MTENKKKWKLQFPTAYTVILFVALFVLVLTYIVPSGKYATIKYNKSDATFLVTEPNGDTKTEAGNAETLAKYGIKTNFESFESGSIWKAIAIPNTYVQIEKPNNSFIDAVLLFLKAPVEGLSDTIDIITFVLILGGIVGVLNKSGAFEAGMNALSIKLKGHELWLIVIVTSLIALGGTTFGLAEETVAFYPILVPVFMAAGFDAMVAIAAIYLGTCVGTMASTINPFSVVIASNTAGISFTDGLGLRVIILLLSVTISILYIIRYARKVKKDPSKSLIYSQKAELEAHFLHNSGTQAPVFDFRKKLMLIILVSGFALMSYGVKNWDWMFEELSVLFFAISILFFFISGLKEKEYVNEFVKGASELLCVALVISLARGCTIIMEQKEISDTLLFWLSGAVSNMNGVGFTSVIYFVYVLLGFFVQSSSGLAVLSMPIMAPLADVVGVPTSTIITAYTLGQGMIGIIAPTGLVLASLAMVNVTFDKWLKFVIPLLVILVLLSLSMLALSVYI